MAGINFPYINGNYSILPSLATTGQVSPISPVAETEPTKTASFSDFLNDAISNTVSTDYDTKKTDIGLMVGETQDLHSVTIAGEKAEIMLNLTVQIRDRMVEAYQEVMRMQI